MLETRPFPPSTRQLAIAFGVGQTWQSQRHFGARAVVGALATLDGLRDGLEPAEAADLVWVHNDPGLYHRLVIERRWAKKRFEEWLYQTLRQQLRP